MRDTKTEKNVETDFDEIINIKLKKYEKDIESIFKDKNYLKIIIDGTEIIEIMLELILINETTQQNMSSQMIKYAIKTSTIPRKTKNVLFEIDRTTSEISEKNVNYKTAYKFLKSFKKFMLWFKNENHIEYIDINSSIGLIDALPNTEPTENNGNYENRHINKINNSIKNLKKHVELVSEVNYIGAVTEGCNVCSLMLELFLRKNGYETDRGYLVLDEKKISVISLCIQQNMLPNGCNKFLTTLEEYKNNLFKLNDSYDLAISFLKGLSCFLIWFDRFYSERFSVDNPFEIEECYNAIYKLTYSDDDEINFEPMSSQTKKHKSEIDTNDGLIISFSNNINSFDLEKTLAALSNDIKDHISKELGNATETIKKDTGTIIETLDDIKKEIKSISLKITDYQSLISRQIKNFDDDKDKDLLIAAFADECAERIVTETDSFKEDDSYNLEKTELTNLLGEEAWGKLSNESKRYLISSKLMFKNLKDIGEILDYSGVCILITKTLELEMYKRFYDRFFEYLNKKYNRSYKNYPTGLLYKNREPLNPEKFNLGTIAYIFCLKTDYNIDYYQEMNNEEKLIEYCEAELFEENETSKIKAMIKEYGNEIEKIRENYRNPSAHRNHITEEDAEDCLNIVLYDKMLLKIMLDSFKI